MSLVRFLTLAVGGLLTLSGAKAAAGIAAPAPAGTTLTAETVQIALGCVLLGYTLGTGVVSRQTLDRVVGPRHGGDQ
ncbi:hypothetical protein EBZ80_25800 [bacterium]|nr:hypothetical protein [bacterium]